MKRWRAAIIMAFFVLMMGGCNQNTTHDGVYVMFKGRPYITKADVFYYGKVVGQIQSKEAHGSSVSRVTVRLAPDFQKKMGTNWAFYVRGGRLMAARINSGGKPINTGEKMCGFNSKAALSWFKFKTLLTDRVTRARMRADALYQRFG